MQPVTCIYVSLLFEITKHPGLLSLPLLQRKMNYQTQKTLLEEQIRINHTLRSYHEQTGDAKWNQTVTAIIATVSDGSASAIAPVVILYCGVLASSKVNLMEGDSYAGVIACLQTLFSQKLRSKLQKQWHNKFKTDKVTDNYYAAVGNYKGLLKGQLDNLDLKFPDAHTSVELNVPSRNKRFQVKFVTQPKANITITINDCKRTYGMELYSQAAPTSVVC